MYKLAEMPRVAICEGPQGVGKSSATGFLKKIGFEVLRGIPSGPELITNRETQSWRYGYEILLRLGMAEANIALDRSLISLMAYDMRRWPQYERLIYQLGASMLYRALDEVDDYCIVAIQGDASECSDREDKASPVALCSLDETVAEHRTYASLFGRLQEDGFSVVAVRNAGITLGEFENNLFECLSGLSLRSGNRWDTANAQTAPFSSAA